MSAANTNDEEQQTVAPPNIFRALTMIPEVVATIGSTATQEEIADFFLRQALRFAPWERRRWLEWADHALGQVHQAGEKRKAKAKRRKTR